MDDGRRYGVFCDDAESEEVVVMGGQPETFNGIVVI